MKKMLILFCLPFMVNINAICQSGGFTDVEARLIGNTADMKMRLFTVDNREDSVFLRRRCAELSPGEIKSGLFGVLHGRMLATVNDPENTGVGLAAPQIGINRRIILVQRFDREGEPFGIYTNPEINYMSDKKSIIHEGCLSVPGRIGNVVRADTVKISYSDAESGERRSETVSGFTAVIFQHEIDHLDGIIYTDREDTGLLSYSFEPDETVCSKRIDITIKNDKIESVGFAGGCAGNTEGISVLVKGMSTDEVVRRLKGIDCKGRGTSCPDQLAIGIERMK